MLNNTRRRLLLHRSIAAGFLFIAGLLHIRTRKHTCGRTDIHTQVCLVMLSRFQYFGWLSSIAYYTVVQMSYDCNSIVRL